MQTECLSWSSICLEIEGLLVLDSPGSIVSLSCFSLVLVQPTKTGNCPNMAEIVRLCKHRSSVTCLTTDAYLTADLEVVSLIPARSHTFMEIDHEIISMVILLPSADSFKKGCCQLQYVYKVLVNHLFKLAQEKW